MFSNVPHDALASREMDRVLQILSHRERRLILYRLKEEETYTLLEKSDTLDESDVELYHVHLPKLEDADYVEWNRSTEQVSRGSRYGEVEPVLTLFGDHFDELPPEWP